jgi:flotillin
MSPLLPIILIGFGVVFLFVIVAGIIGRYRMCPPDKILVVFGKVGAGGGASRCYNGGATFVIPFFQNYAYLDLSPLSIEIPLRSALSSQNIRVSAPANFTIAISNDPQIMGNAATRLLGRRIEEIREIAREIITGQMRVVIASMTIEEINSDREKLIGLITKGVEVELRKIGLHMINCNITDITDDSGYIEALGKEAAAKAINEAQVKVALETQRGSIGKAEAEREQQIRVAEALAAAQIGQNKAQQDIVASQAELAERKAEADRRAEVAQKTAKAQAEEESYAAQRKAEDARAQRDEAALKADEVSRSNAMKEKVRVDSEAEALRAQRIAEGQAAAVRATAAGDAAAIRLRAEAEAAGIAMKLKAEAEGKQALLDAQADGLAKFTQNGRNADAAIQLILAQQLTEIATIQAGAIAKLKFDKVVVLGGGKEAGASSFIQDLFKGVLPIHEIARSAGINLPGYLGTPEEASVPVPPASRPNPPPAPPV